MTLVYSAQIEDDLDAITEFIAADNPRRAVRFVREIYAQIRRIGDAPLLYQLRSDVGPEARLAVVSRYVILFRVDNEVVYIEWVVYGGRDLPPLFNQ